MPSLKVWLLGPPRIEVDGGPVEIKRRKALALLIYLAVTSESQRRDTLATLLWPDSSQSSARAALRRDLSILNKALGGDWLVSERETITLQAGPDLWLDIEQFQQHVTDCTDSSPACLEILAKAANLYRDDFLTGFTLPDCPNFDEWQFFQAEGLRQKLASVLERLVDGHSAVGDCQQAIPYARRWLALDPLHEPAHRHLMQLYAWDGQQAAALRQYDECVRILEEEVGAPPSEETTGLYEAIKAKRLPPPSEAEEQSGKGAGEASPLHPRSPIPRHNLPAQTTAFIGRTRELAQVREQLSRPEVRLLTLTGPGGTGKTRLGLQAASEALKDFTDGVFFVELAPISDPNLVDLAIVETLGVRPTGDRPVVERLKEYLRDKYLLLVLDNFEHVLEAAPIVTALLAASPNLKVLVTSRTLLRLSGEWDYPVPPLNLPDPNNLPPLERLVEYEAMQMFSERGRAVKADFALTDDNAVTVAEICAKLDGLPLAIELAAARIRLMPPQKILIQLSSRLQFLTGGARDLPARQQTLRDTIDWSYNLLEPEEQTLFQRLAVFAAGCTFEAAEAVGSIDGAVDVLNGLESLVDKNLLKQSEVRDEPRFGMLETIREYGLERLTENGEAQTIKQTYARYFMEMAEEAEPHMNGPEQVTWVKRLEVEHDNLRGALAWSIDNDIEIGLRLAAALGRFWQFQGHLSEGRDWLAKALAAARKGGGKLDRFRARALQYAGKLLYLQGDITAACVLSEESVMIWRQVGDQRGLADALCDFGNRVRVRGDQAEARTLLEESIALFRQLKDKAGLARSLFWYGEIALREDDYPRARARAEESIALGREVGDISHVAGAISVLGRIELRQGNYIKAQSSLEESLTLFQQVEDKIGIAFILDHIGSLAYIQGYYEQAQALFEQSLQIWRALDGMIYVVATLYNLGCVSYQLNNGTQAAASFREGLALSFELKEKQDIARCLEGLALVAEAERQQERATQLFGVAEALREAENIQSEAIDRFDRLPVTMQAEYERHIASARTALGDEAFEAIYAEGRAMSLEEAVAYALER